MASEKNQEGSMMFLNEELSKAEVSKELNLNDMEHVSGGGYNLKDGTPITVALVNAYADKFKAAGLDAGKVYATAQELGFPAVRYKDLEEAERKRGRQADTWASSVIHIINDTKFFA